MILIMNKHENFSEIKTSVQVVLRLGLNCAQKMDTTDQTWRDRLEKPLRVNIFNNPSEWDYERSNKREEGWEFWEIFNLVILYKMTNQWGERRMTVSLILFSPPISVVSLLLFWLKDSRTLLYTLVIRYTYEQQIYQ